MNKILFYRKDVKIKLGGSLMEDTAKYIPHYSF